VILNVALAFGLCHLKPRKFSPDKIGDLSVARRYS
jgi:hypothetical protein